MTPDEVLDKAADILQFEREWGKGNFECDTGAVCVDGAMRLAVYGQVGIRGFRGKVEYFEARQALRNAVKREMPEVVQYGSDLSARRPNLWDWNDDFAPNKEYVIDKLRDVAKELRG